MLHYLNWCGVEMLIHYFYMNDMDIYSLKSKENRELYCWEHENCNSPLRRTTNMLLLKLNYDLYVFPNEDCYFIGFEKKKTDNKIVISSSNLYKLLDEDSLIEWLDKNANGWKRMKFQTGLYQFKNYIVFKNKDDMLLFKLVWC